MSAKSAGAGQEKAIYTVCNTHCGGQCLLKAYVKDGVITRIETDDRDEPQLRACLRGRSQRAHVYAPDRLKYPMRRTGERGEGKFERITWDEALEKIASEIKRINATYGPGAIVYRGGGADLGFLNSRKPIDALLGMTGGYSQTWGYISHEGGRYASLATFGTPYTRSSRADLLNSRLIILWGLNPTTTVQDCNTGWYLIQAKESGIKIISVDPRYTESTARLADQWIPIRPGTDTAMLVAMAYVMVKENLQDQKFLDRYTVGFDKFREYLTGEEDGVPKTPEWAAAITTVPAKVIRQLAREYAAAKPAALVCGIAPGRTAYGEQYHRAAHTLAAMTGNVGVPGGDNGGRCFTAIEGYGFMKLGPGMSVNNAFDRDAPRRKFSLMGDDIRDKGRVNTSRIADAVLQGKKGGYPTEYKMLYCANSNYVNQAPFLNKTLRAFAQLEFIAVQEQFMTPMARYADILLPVNTFLERNDICVGEGVPFYGYMAKAVEPLYESKSHLEIGIALAEKLGIKNFNDKTEDGWLRQMVAGSYVTDYEEFKKKGIYRPEIANDYVAFRQEIEDPEHHPFPTPSGKIEIYCQRMAEMNNPELPPVPKYIETWESINDPLAKKYPLQMITSHFRRRAHTQFETIPWLRELQEQAIWLSTADAAKRGIRNGDLVRIFNDRGQMIIKAQVTERIMPGVIDVPQGAWFAPDKDGTDRGGCANVLTNDRVSPGGAVPFNTGLVQVEKA